MLAAMQKRPDMRYFMIIILIVGLSSCSKSREKSDLTGNGHLKILQHELMAFESVVATNPEKGFKKYKILMDFQDCFHHKKGCSR
jgi:hypothetical protein